MMLHRILHLGAVLAALAGPVAVSFWVVPAQAQSQGQSRAQLLDSLFATLKSAPDGTTARRISAEIWTLWTQPEDPELAERMALVLERLGMSDLGGAVALLDQLVIDYPDYAEGWNQRATMHFLLGNYDQSLDDIAKTLQFEPRHFGALAGRALIYLERGQRDRALAAITEALAIHPFLGERALFPELNAIPI